MRKFVYITLALTLFVSSASFAHADHTLDPPTGPGVVTLDELSGGSLVVSGNAEPGATVTLESTTGIGCSTTAASDGTYSCTFGSVPNDGETLFATASLDGHTSSARTPIASVRESAPRNSGFSRTGIFGCAGGDRALSPGAFQATQGIYVPVNDAAVTINTGILVYKECVLDGMQTRMREAAAAELVRHMINWINTGRGGSAQFVQNFREYLREQGNEEVLDFLEPHSIGGVCSPFQNNVRATLARTYLRETQQPTHDLTCSINLSEADFAGLIEGGRWGGYDAFHRLISDRTNNPYGAFTAARQKRDERLARSSFERDRYLMWGNGFIPVEERTQVPVQGGGARNTRSVVTPGSLVSRLVSQYAGSGFRQLENATEIDQIINTLFSSLGNQIVSGVRGFSGVSRSSGGQPPYLSRLAAEAQAGVRQGAANTALAILTTALQAESTYNTHKRSILASLRDGEADLRAAEAQCWSLIVPAVEAYAVEAACTSTEDPDTGEIERECDDPIPLEIALQNVNTGDIALRTTTNSQTAQGPVAQFSITGVSSPVQSGTLAMSTNVGVVFPGDTVLEMSLTTAPITEGTAEVPVVPTNPFTGGRFTFEVTPRQYINAESLQYEFQPANPIQSGAIEVILEPIYPFANQVISGNITPLEVIALRDIATSDAALATIQQLVNDVTNTTSQTVQRLALERLDQMVINNELHSAYDARDAGQQATNVAATITELVNDTVTEWGSGSNWCNVANESVVETWFNRWRADGGSS